MLETKTRLIGKKRILDLLTVRSFAYTLLKRFLIEESTKGFLNILIEEELLDQFPWAGENGDIRDGLEALTFFLRDPELLTPGTLTKLESDYLTLFIGTGRLKAPPWESVYLSQRKIVYQEHTLAVREAYARAGYRAKNMGREPDDHIALELDFMASLTDEAAKAFRAGKLYKAKKALMAQKDFLSDHILKWAPKLADNIIESAATDYYRGIARLLLGLIQVDKGALSELLDQIAARIKKERQKNRLKVV